MSLTLAGGPLSTEPSGELNAELERGRPLLYLEPMPYRIRALVGGETLIDAFEPLLLHESGRLPVYCFRPGAVRWDLLEASGSFEDDTKGGGELWTLRVGGRVAADAARSYTRPAGTAPFLEGLLTVDWSSVDEWFCEDEQLFGHPRDPYSRIDTYRTTRHVRISLDGCLLADTRRATALYETGLPPRYYIPADDVRTELLEPSSSRTRCAYKGSASYWSVRLDGRLVDDLVWSYPDPQHDAEPVRDLLCFFNERVDLELEGTRTERPRTQWSRDDERGVEKDRPR